MADFISDEPSPELNLMTFYIYNITNPADTIQRGFKPRLVETGPYGYSKATYKYDILFDAVNPDLVTFKEYSILSVLEDPAGRNERSQQQLFMSNFYNLHIP